MRKVIKCKLGTLASKFIFKRGRQTFEQFMSNDLESIYLVLNFE